MNLSLLNTEIQRFINDNLNSDLNKILLSKPYFDEVSNVEIVEQIKAKQRCKSKLSTWFDTEKIIYPNKKNIEQTSSEITAEYKSTLLEGDKIIDLTGGFGVDSYYFSQRFNKVTHCEINHTLSRIAKHNYSILGVNNVNFIDADGLEFLKSTNQSFENIYVDPSRRHDIKGKVFYLKDCEPNIVENLDFLFDVSKSIMVKTSPMLDISIALKELKNVFEIHIVAIKNEVKELLFLLRKNWAQEPTIKTINFGADSKEIFSFHSSSEKNTILNTGKLENYLYEPNAAIMKSGAFNLLAKHFSLKKLHKHSHLYTSSKKVDFPGRVFEIKEVIDYNKKELKTKFKGQKWNVSTRNFPLKPDALEKLFNISTGGNNYVFFTTISNNDKVVVVSQKVN